MDKRKEIEEAYKRARKALDAAFMPVKRKNKKCK